MALLNAVFKNAPTAAMVNKKSLQAEPWRKIAAACVMAIIVFREIRSDESLSGFGCISALRFQFTNQGQHFFTEVFDFFNKVQKAGQH